jgi:Holliday junction resolvase RusA-like endonuclease
MKEMFFMIPGAPIAKKRPRFSFSFKKQRVYDAQKEEGIFARQMLKAQMIENLCYSFIECPVDVKMTFYTPIPKSWSKKKRESRNLQPDPRRPDLDNYEKFYADAMNLSVLKDDSQIVSTQCKKLFSINPRTEIVVRKYPLGD